MSDPLLERIAATLGRPVRAVPLSGSAALRILLVELPGGERIVAKAGTGHLALERTMLDDLARLSDLPLPAVLHGADDLLLLEHVAHDGGAPGPRAQHHAAELVAALHARTAERFGYRIATVIGQLPQPNPWTERWVPFFRDHRLRHMAEQGHREGTVPARLLQRLESLAGRLDRYLDEPARPALLHGDIWTGNVLTRGDRIAAFIDPAVYYGHPEIELAFTTLFGTFGVPFFRRYAELVPFDTDGFFELRRDLYNLYPLLVHVRFVDPGYARPIERTLDRLGL